MMGNMDRKGTLVDLGQDGAGRHLARGQNFTVERIEADPGEALTLIGEDEMMILCLDAVVRLSGDDTADIAPRTVAIVPPGKFRLAFVQRGRVFAFATRRLDLPVDAAINAATYAVADDRVAPIGEPFRRARDAGNIQLLPIDEIKAPASNPRIKCIQSATMSINWVEYNGPRDRSALSPHAHRDFEQGSLAIDGGFVHHLRAPWKSNAELWQDDVHMTAGADSLLIVPPEIIHTSEGVGAERHLLIDVFAPPRRDFIANGWMCNEADYLDPLGSLVAAS